MKKIKIISLLSAFIFLFSACETKIKPIKSKGDELTPVFYIDSCPVNFEELRYITVNYKKDMEIKYGDDIWMTQSEKYRTELEEKVFSAAKKYPVLKSMLDEYKIDTSNDEVTDYVNSYINDFAKSLGGKAEYKASLEENGMTDHYLRYMLTLEACREKLRQALCVKGIIDDSPETALKSIESDEFIRTLHVFISNDEGEDIEANRKRAEKALSELDAGEKLTTVIGRYSEDYLMTTTDGYYFTRTEYEKAYEDAAFALEIGEHSGVVEGENGFYVIARLEKDKDYIKKNFDTLKERYIYVKFDEILTEAQNNAVLTLTEFGKSLDLTKIS